MKRPARRLLPTALVLVFSAFMSVTAWSTDGYFQLGFGPVQNSLGGAGVANSEDAMSMALNPAGIVGLGGQFQIGAALFMPDRGYSAMGTGFIAPGGFGSGTIESSNNAFVIPNIAYSRPIDADSAIGLVVYGNGGMNTTYGDVPNAACGGGSGVFCGGPAGVDLMQVFLSVDYARRLGNVSFGIAPTFAVQRFAAKGLGFFGVNGYSSDPTHLTDNGYDWSFGGGLRAGIQVDVTEQLRLGVSGQTKMWMTKFDRYSGLFADQGSFDIPASVTAGIAYDVTPNMTVMADYQRIFYGGVGSISRSSAVTPGSLGTTGGPGFGWHDVDVYKLGVEYRASPSWTLRAGYAFSDNPIRPVDVTFNILSPGVVRHHISAGASYKVDEKSSIDLGFVFAPESKVTGPAMNGGNVELHMQQFIGQIGWTRKF